MRATKRALVVMAGLVWASTFVGNAHADEDLGMSSCEVPGAALVRAAVTAVDTHHVEDPAFPYAVETVATLDVLEVLTGVVPATSVRVWAPGGAVSPDDYLLASHQLYPVLGEAGVVCLRPDTGLLAEMRGATAGEAPYYFMSSAKGQPGAMTGLGLHQDLNPDDEHAKVDSTVFELEEVVFGYTEAVDSKAPRDKGYVITRPPFKYRDMPLRFSVNPNTADVTGEASAVVGGAKAWESGGSWVNLTYAGTTPIVRTDAADGVRAAFWNYPPDGGGCTDHVARVFVANNSFDIEFNDFCRFVHASPPPRGTFDVQAVAAHEFGHALGLGHTNVTGNLMCTRNGRTCQSPDGGQRWLGSGDAAGIRAQYPYNSYRTAVSSMENAVEVLRGQGSQEVTVNFVNLGGTPWNAFRTVGHHTDYPTNRCSIFDGSGTSAAFVTPFVPWDRCNQPRAILENSTFNRIIESGETATVRFRFNAPLEAGGTYIEKFALLLDGGTRMSGSAHSFTVHVSPDPGLVGPLPTVNVRTS